MADKADVAEIMLQVKTLSDDQFRELAVLLTKEMEARNLKPRRYAISGRVTRPY